MTLAVLNIVFLALSPVLFKFSSYMQERATHWSSEDRIRRFWIDFAIAAAEIVLVGVIWMAFHRLSVGSGFHWRDDCAVPGHGFGSPETAAADRKASG